MGKSTISMAIFNSYVKLPEDNKWPSAGFFDGMVLVIDIWMEW